MHFPRNPWRFIPAMTLSVAVLLSARPFSCGNSGTAEAGAAEAQIRGVERVHVLERIRQQQEDVTSVRATVVQKKRHPLLKAEAVSEGILLLKKPNLLRWEVQRPERTIIVIDGHSIVAYHPDRKEAERRELGDNLTSLAAAEFLASGMRLAVPELEKRFQVELSRESGQVVLRLIPRSRWLAQAIASIAIYQNENEAVPRQIVVIGKQGDRTETALTNVTINPKFSDDPFALRLGPEVRVTDVGKPAGRRDDGR